MADGERVAQLESQVQTLAQRVELLEMYVLPVSARTAAQSPPPAPAPPPADWPASWTQPPPPPAAKPEHPGLSITPSRVLAIAGGLVLLLGVGYLLRYAVAQGWLGPPVRVLLALAGSGVLAVVGLRLERADATRLVGQICTATASAGAYAAVVAAVVLYELIATPVGLLAAALIAGVAVGHGARTRNVGITALGVGGALASPVLVGADGAATLGLLLVALTAGLGVAVRRAWPAVTALAFAVVTPQLWSIGMERASVAVALPFAAACGALVLVACTLHARGKDWDAAWVPVAVGATNALSTAALGFFVLNERVAIPGDWPSVWLLAVAVAHLGVGLVLARRYFSPPMAVAMALAGLVIGDAAVLVLTGGYTAGLLLGLLALVAAAALHPAWLRDTAEPLVMAQLLVFGAHALGDVVDLPAVASMEAVVLVAALCAAAVAFAGLVPAKDRALAVLGAAVFGGLAVLRLLDAEAPLGSLLDGPPDLLVVVVMCVAIAGAAFLLGHLLHRRFWIAAVVVVNYALSLAAVSLDPQGLGRVALTGLWAGAGGAALVAGRRRALPDVRRGGAALLAAAVSKAALVDTTTLDGTYRAIALLLCGAVLVATAVSEARAAGTGNHTSAPTP